ncbi:hypothetical protein F7725_010551 [Dissostichus mawsoni]|uniref:Interleukin n=1 Tax=Dissostichus mawsoni TaxID=36200 RepID=A0A7J5XPK4_DISMA|nr:hypothetical protein F7725_010551 [Dissostichus mawsoni]
MKCFQDNLKSHFNTTDITKLSRSLNSTITEKHLCSSGSNTMLQCTDCNSHPRENAGTFFKRLESLVQKYEDSRFYAPTNVKTHCITDALECMRRELSGTAKTECEDFNDYMVNSVDSLDRLIKKRSENDLGLTNSNECACGGYEEKPFAEFVKALESLLQPRNGSGKGGDVRPLWEAELPLRQGQINVLSLRRLSLRDNLTGQAPKPCCSRYAFSTFFASWYALAILCSDITTQAIHHLQGAVSFAPVDTVGELPSVVLLFVATDGTRLMWGLIMQ